MVRVDIEYCAPCRIAGTAVTTQRVLADRLREYDEINDLRLKPTEEKVLSVRVDGDRIWSTDPRERIDPVEAVDAVRKWLRS